MAKTRAIRIEEAEFRAEMYGKLNNNEKLELIVSRRGESSKEKERILKLINKENSNEN